MADNLERSEHPKVMAEERANRLVNIVDISGKEMTLADWANILAGEIKSAEDSARAEALEEAAKVVEKRKDRCLNAEFVFLTNACTDMAKEIRSLSARKAR